MSRLTLTPLMLRVVTIAVRRDGHRRDGGDAESSDPGASRRGERRGQRLADLVGYSVGFLIKI